MVLLPNLDRGQDWNRHSLWLRQQHHEWFHEVLAGEPRCIDTSRRLKGQWRELPLDAWAPSESG